MTEKKDPTTNKVDRDRAATPEILDFGDVMIETKQQSFAFLYPDCVYAYGTKYGC